MTSVDVRVVTDHRFEAMGTECHVQVVDGPDEACSRIEASVRADEARWSRFRPSSELSRINRMAGRRTDVSAETVEVVELAVTLRRATGRLFDPLVGGHVIAAGYDRPFPFEPATTATTPVPPPPPPDDPETGPGWVQVPAGLRLDLGGIAKGHSADRGAALALSLGAAGVCVNLGGDIACLGAGPDPSGWWFDLDHVGHALVGLTGGGVATSTVLRRRWRTADGRFSHHLIDPRTGRPADTALSSVTVVAGDAATAEALTKVALMAPVDDAERVLVGHGAVAIATTADGTVHHLGDTAPYLWSGSRR